MAESFLPPVVARLLADATEFKAGLASAGADLEAFTAESSGRFEALASAGKTAFLAIGAAAVGLGAESIHLASDFQSSMERLHTQAQVPQESIKGLSADVLKLAGDVGLSPNSLAAGLYHVESAFQSTGITGKDAMDILKTAAQGAAMGGSDLVDTTNALDAVIVAGIHGVQGYQQAMGMLNAVVGTGDMTMQDMADALSNGVMPVVKNYGLSLTDVGAALATFGDNNIRGAQAGTALRMAVQAMAVPIKGGKDVLEGMGLTMGSLAKDMQSGGLIPALQDLRAHMEKVGYTGEQTGQILTEIFGKRAGTGVAVLFDQLDRLKSKYSDIDQASKNFGEDWTETQKTFKQQLNELVASAEALGVKIGTWLIPKVREMSSALADGAKWLVHYRALVIGLAVGIGGPLVAAMVAFIATQAIALAPVLAVMAAISALTAAVLYAWDHWVNFRIAVKATADILMSTVKLAFDFVKDIIKIDIDIITGIIHVGLDLITGHWGQAWQAMEDALGRVAGDIVNLVTDWLSGLNGVLHGFLGHVWDEGFAIGRQIVDGIGQGIESLGGWIKDKVESVVMAPVNLVKGLLGIHSPSRVFAEMGRNLAEGLVIGLNDGGRNVRSAMSGMVIGSPSVLPSAMAGSVFSGIAAGASGSQGINLNINMGGTVVAGRELTRIVVNALTAEGYRVGNTYITRS